MPKQSLNWNDPKSLRSRHYTCGYCGSPVASERGWFGSDHGATAFIFICHQCSGPTFFDLDGTQFPGPAFGNVVKDISDSSVKEIYDEARRATSAASYTAAVLCLRKLLMHVAVSKGAKPGDTFVAYVDFLAAKNYVPPDAKDWVDHIRKRGNDANHEITIMKKEDAEELLAFAEMLLKVIYEFPATMKRKYGTQPTK